MLREKGPRAGDAGPLEAHPSRPLIKSPGSPRQAPTAWKRAATDTLLIVRAKFPQCFARLDLPRRQPLKIGIHLDIAGAMPELPAVDVGRALKLYTCHFSYLSQCIEGRHRVGLDGKSAGIVTAREAKHAAELVAKIKRKGQPNPVSPPAPTSPRLTLAALKDAARKRAVAVGAS